MHELNASCWTRPVFVNHENDAMFRLHDSRSSACCRSPCVTSDLPQSMTLELSARVKKGSGENWLVDMYDKSTGEWTNMGGLSSAGASWTSVSLTVTSDDLIDYLDPDLDDQILVSFYNPSDAEV